MTSPTLPVVTGDKDRSLQDALSRLTSSRVRKSRSPRMFVTVKNSPAPISSALREDR